MLAAAKAKKDELAKSWGSLSEGLPKMLEAVQSRVDVLSKSKKLPKNITADQFAEVKSGLAESKQLWDKAQESYKAGNLADAISAAKTVKDKTVKAMGTLGLPVPEAAKS